MSKIKSIKLIKEFPCSANWNIKIGKIYAVKDFIAISPFCNSEATFRITEAFTEFFETEYESELKILKRPDGSLISEPEEGQEVIFLLQHSNSNIFAVSQDHYYQNDDDYNGLIRGLTYLPKDLELAEKKARMLTKQLEITNKIERLNAEENWVADWNYQDDKFFLKYDNENAKILIDYNWKEQSGVLYSSKSILQEIKQKYSKDEIKQFLGITI